MRKQTRPRKLQKGFWPWIGRNHEQLKILFAVIAGAYVLYEYVIKISDARVAKSLEFVKRFNDPAINDAKIKLDRFWEARPDSEWKKIVNRDNFYKVVPKMIEKEGLGPDLRVLGTFYRDMSLCVQEKQCDGDKLCDYFFADIQAFRHNYKWHLQQVEWRNSTSEILEKLVKESCVTRYRSYCGLHSSPLCAAVMPAITPRA